MYFLKIKSFPHPQKKKSKIDSSRPLRRKDEKYLRKVIPLCYVTYSVETPGVDCLCNEVLSELESALRLS